jgi:hypothetical protein
MKIDFIKTENCIRISSGIIFYALAAISLIGVCKGNYYHVTTMLGYFVLATAILRRW